MKARNIKMEDTLNNSETVSEQKLDTQSVIEQVAPQKSNDELDAIRKEREQLEMERNMLRNKLAEKEKAEAELKQKQLQENEEYKTLWEQTQAQLREVTEAQERAATLAEISAKEKELSSQYSEEVLDIAKTAGLKLDATDEDAVSKFQSALEKISSKVGRDTKPSPENHSGQSRDNLSQAQAIERLRSGDKSAVSDAVGGLSFVKAYGESLK